MLWKNRKALVVLLLFITLSLSGSQVLNFEMASAFKPNTHIMTGNTAIRSILDGLNAVNINGRLYPVDHRIADAIRSYPDYYRGGLVGPDAFPDIYVGQAFIHPDTRCANGLKKGNECYHGLDHSFTHEWLRHVYDSAWNYYIVRNGDEEAKKTLAFAYGFLAHGAGDIWSHTLVNNFSDGIFPGPTEIADDYAKIPHATRHIIVEGYIGEHTPNTILTINSPSDFIFSTLIDSNFVDSRGKTADSLGQGQIFSYFYNLRDRLVQKATDLQREATELQRMADACAPFDFSCSRTLLLFEKLAVEQTKAYAEEWIKDIDSGLRAWPQMSQGIAYNLFSDTEEGHIDRAVEVTDDFVGDHLLSMLGAPDRVGASYNLIDDISDFVQDLLGEVVQPIKDFRNYLILHTTGINLPALKEFYTSPANYVNTPGSVIIGGQTIEIGLPFGTSQKLDRLMGINNAIHNPEIKFNPERFAASKNTITLIKLSLLTPQTLNQLLKDHGAIPIYTGIGNGYGRSNAMLDFVRSLDANHQWRLNSIREGDIRPDGSPRQHSEGMPLWVACLARERVFRVLFIDWENTNFPDLGEGCRRERIFL
jgi:hypothetical protein